MAKAAVTFDDIKFRLRLADNAAKRADRTSGALFDKWMSETLSLAKGRPIERATAILFRT